MESNSCDSSAAKCPWTMLGCWIRHFVARAPARWRLNTEREQRSNGSFKLLLARLNFARQFRARNGNLLSGVQILKRERVRLHFVLGHNQSEACFHLTGGLQRLLQTKALVAQFCYYIMTPQLVRDFRSLPIHSRTKRCDINIRLSRHCFRRFLQREHQAILADSESDPRRTGPSQSFRKAIIPASTENRILRAQRSVSEFECSPGVIVQAADKTIVQREGHLHCLKDFLHFLKMLAATFVEKLTDARQFVDDGLVLGNLAIKHAQRIGHCPPLAVATHFVHHRLQRLSQGLVVNRAIIGTAHRIQLQSPIIDAEPVKKRRQHFQHLRIACWGFAPRSRRPDSLRPNLIKLPVTPFLWTLTPYLGPDVVQLTKSAIPKLVLDVGSHHSRCIFRTKCQRLPLLTLPTPAILPRIHLFRNDVG